MASEHGIGLVVVDNSDDVDRLEATVPQGRAQDVLVRVIPGVEADTHASVLTGHEGSKFGLAPAAAAELIGRIERSPRLRMRGLHVHVGSQILDVEPFAQSVAPIAALGEFPVYDLGGGLGARYTYDDDPPVGRRVPRRARRRGARAPARRGRADRRARAQHGRVRRGDALPRRHRQAREASRSSRSTAAWATTSRWRCSTSASRRGSPAGSTRRTARLVTLVGRHCESGDVLVDGVRLDAPRVGDLVARPGDRGVLPHDGQQLQRQPQDPGGVRGRRCRPGSWCVARPGPTCSRATSTETRGSDGVTARADPAAQAGRPR